MSVLFCFFLPVFVAEKEFKYLQVIKERKILTEQENKQKKVTCIKCMWKFDGP